jgi:HlyD family secretion protein
LEEQREHHVVRAPASGVLVGFTGWSPGAQVVAGQSLGVLSPGDALRIESRVSTRDIGFVRAGQAVRLQVDAYPYTQWGMVDGAVESIGADLVTAGEGGGPGYFKVLIRPRATHLALPNGVRGELKKGLTLAVRYVVVRRSLLQVLHDDASAWLNPQDGRHP